MHLFLSAGGSKAQILAQLKAQAESHLGNSPSDSQVAVVEAVASEILVHLEPLEDTSNATVEASLTITVRR